MRAVLVLLLSFRFHTMRLKYQCQFIFSHFSPHKPQDLVSGQMSNGRKYKSCVRKLNNIAASNLLIHIYLFVFTSNWDSGEEAGRVSCCSNIGSLQALFSIAILISSSLLFYLIVCLKCCSITQNGPNALVWLWFRPNKWFAKRLEKGIF